MNLGGSYNNQNHNNKNQQQQQQQEEQQQEQQQQQEEKQEQQQHLNILNLFHPNLGCTNCSPASLQRSLNLTM